jgi:hypothetical protein
MYSDDVSMGCSGKGSVLSSPETPHSSGETKIDIALEPTPLRE